MSVLILLTKNYPSGKGEYFLHEEVKMLAGNFDKIYILPLYYHNNRRLLQGINILPGLLKYPFSLITKVNIILTGIFSKEFWEEISNKYIIATSQEALKRLIFFIYSSKIIFVSVKDIICEEMKQCSHNNIIVYTYWMEGETLGIIKLKKLFPSLKVITRAHEIDLYEYRHTLNYIPLREKIISQTDNIFLISKDGYNYLKSKYPQYAYKYKIAYLGVKIPKNIAMYSKDNIFRIYSCCFISPIKNLFIMFDILTLLDKRQHSQEIEWHHIGDGPLFDTFLNKIKSSTYKHIKIVPHGFMHNKDILKLYGKEPVDVFINLSLSEGIPVSIMEAMSFGIPVIAPDTGGINELVNTNSGGFLLQTPLNNNEICETILFLMNEKSDSRKRRRNLARQYVEKLFNAKNNFDAFIKEIKQICAGYQE